MFNPFISVRSIFLPLLLGSVVLGTAAQAQEISQTPLASKGRVWGYLDAANGAFVPRAARPADVAAAEAAAATASVVNGKIVLNISITLSTAIPTTNTIVCSGTASVTEYDSTSHLYTGWYNEMASNTATRSGSTAKCTVTIPYAWSLVNPGSDTVSVGYSVNASGTTYPTRMFSSYYSANFTVPASGTTTTKSFNVTL